MEDGQQPHAFGSGQQRAQHPRPFFYVQPPSQPYCLYQHWQLNNPYSHYGLPGGFNFSRPLMHPFQYMQYPGFVFPHAPIYPMDYRRMFEPRFHGHTWNDMPRQQYHPQPQGRREMACSEAQTDPSDAITKLIECLDKIRGSELQATERELDSGVASQSSGMFSPGEEKRSEEQGHVLPSAPDCGHLESPPVTFSDSTTAVYDGDSSQRSLGALSPQGCWSRGLEEELPLDSSSVHEECSEGEQPAADKHFLPLEVTDIQSDTSVTDPSVTKCDAEELLKQRLDPVLPSTPVPSSSFTSNQPALTDAKSNNKVSKPEHQKTDQNYQILKLPFESILTHGKPEASHLSSHAAPYYYNYLSMHATHERMSVLSPSLDELSSKDEMFSTDLDDADLFPKHVYTGRRLAESISGSPQAVEEVEEVWSGSKRFICACCGKSLAKGAGISKAHSSKIYRDEARDSEEDSRYGRGCEQPVRMVVRKHSAPRKPHPFPKRHAAKPWYKRGQYKDPSDPVNLEEDHDLCKQESADGEIGEMTSSELQCRTCQDRLYREDVTTSDQGRWGDDDVIPRRRQAASLQHQEMSTQRTQRKVMYHRPRDEDNDDDEPPPLHWERDMEAATSTMQHSYGLGHRGPNPPHAAQQAQGPHEPATGHSGAPRPEEQHQQHHKPFFYIQPSQPYLPMQSLQWPMPVPMPVSYNPYYGYPGLGYGMPVMPNYQQNPYIEPPSFVVPHTHLHLMDYRRMLNPQYYQTMAYHSRRFRYQHNSQAREMTSSEVQTEPLSATQRTSTPEKSNVESSHSFPAHESNNIPSVSTSQPLPPALAVQNGKHSLELKDAVPTSTTRTSPNGNFVIQTEEVRIECCTTPVGLQLLHSHETAEVSHNFSQDIVQCGSILQGRVLQDKVLCPPTDQSEQAPQACPDILLVGTPSSGDKIPALEESRSQMDPVTVTSSCGSQIAACSDVQDTSGEKNLSMTSKNFHLKVVHLPFDQKYLDKLRRMESTVWSMEDTLIPSPELLVQNGHTGSIDETVAVVAEVPSSEAQTVKEETPTEDIIPIIEMLPLMEDELEDLVPTVEGLGDEMLSEPDMCPMMDDPVAEQTPVTELTHTAEVDDAPYLLVLDNSPPEADNSKHRREMNVQDHQDTSFESLPAYLPSTSWLADFDNVYYCSKWPPTPKKQNRPSSSQGLGVPSRRRKLDLEYKEQLTIRKPKERYKPKGKVDRQSLSDHECCLSRKFNENMFSPSAFKRERLCTRCLAKCRICMSASPGLNSQIIKQSVPFQQRNDTPLPTCETCKSYSKKQLMRKGSSPNIHGHHHGHDTEGESSENSSCRTRTKWRAIDDLRKLNDLKRPLASKQNLETCSTAMHPKLREKNCVCNEPQHQSVAWQRLHHCPHGKTKREMDENCALPLSLQTKCRNIDQIYRTHGWKKEQSWKAVMPNPDINGSKNEARSQHLKKHQKSQPQSQGTHRKDTRC